MQQIQFRVGELATEGGAFCSDYDLLALRTELASQLA